MEACGGKTKKKGSMGNRSYFKHSYITYTARVTCQHHVTSGHGCPNVITFTRFSTSLPCTSNVILYPVRPCTVFRHGTITVRTVSMIILSHFYHPL